jgi:hypothetical protein
MKLHTLLSDPSLEATSSEEAFLSGIPETIFRLKNIPHNTDSVQVNQYHANKTGHREKHTELDQAYSSLRLKSLTFVKCLGTEGSND